MEEKRSNDDRESDQVLATDQRGANGPVDPETKLAARADFVLLRRGDETAINSPSEDGIPDAERTTPASNPAPALTPEERAVVECLKLLASVGRAARLAREGAGEEGRKGE